MKINCQIVLHLFFALVSLFITTVTQAQTITPINTTSVEITKLDEIQILVGDQFFLITQDHKKVAIVQINAITNGKASAILKKGKINEQYTNYSLAKINSERSTFGANQSAGVLISYIQNSAQVNLSSSTSINLTGSSFLLAGFYEKNIEDSFVVEGRLSYEGLNGSGSTDASLCDSGNCNINVNYLGLSALIKFPFNFKKFQLSLGIGASELFAISKSSNIIDTSTINTSEKIIASIQSKWKLNRKTYIPVEVEYFNIPNKSAVKVNQYCLTFGWGYFL